MRANLNRIDWQYVREEEKRTRHDVMTHVHAFERVCPSASGVIHLGATSCFVQDNADLIIIKQALGHTLDKAALCLDRSGQYYNRFALTLHGLCQGLRQLCKFQTGAVRARVQIGADSGAHSLPAGNSEHSRQTCLSLGTGLADRFP